VIAMVIVLLKSFRPLMLVVGLNPNGGVVREYIILHSAIGAEGSHFGVPRL
jgi:hypothetical protein